MSDMLRESCDTMPIWKVELASAFAEEERAPEKNLMNMTPFAKKKARVPRLKVSDQVLCFDMDSVLDTVRCQTNSD